MSEITLHSATTDFKIFNIVVFKLSNFSWFTCTTAFLLNRSQLSHNCLDFKNLHLPTLTVRFKPTVFFPEIEAITDVSSQEGTCAAVCSVNFL
jgi:hypothetical protein